jgi:hypothetical protein
MSVYCFIKGEKNTKGILNEKIIMDGNSERVGRISSVQDGKE